MTQIPHSPNGFLPPISSAGVVGNMGPAGISLAAGTYFVPFGSPSALIDSVSAQWDATAVAVLTVEDTNNPAVANNSNAAGDGWNKEDPSTAYVPISGGTVANMTVTIPGGTAGSCMINVGNNAAARKRLRVVVATPGFFIFTGNGKA